MVADKGVRLAPRSRKGTSRQPTQWRYDARFIGAMRGSARSSGRRRLHRSSLWLLGWQRKRFGYGKSRELFRNS